MAGSMNWTGMENLIDAVDKTKNDWINAAESIKMDTINKLGEGYSGTAAETTSTKIDEIKKEATRFFDEVASQLSKKLSEQKAAWEEQERKAQNSVEG